MNVRWDVVEKFEDIYHGHIFGFSEHLWKSRLIIDKMKIDTSKLFKTNLFQDISWDLEKFLLKIIIIIFYRIMDTIARTNK